MQHKLFCALISSDSVYDKCMVSVFTARCTLVQSAVLRSHVVGPSVRLSVRPSVRPSVRELVDQDHIGWKSWKLIARTSAHTFPLRSPKSTHLHQGQHGEIFGKTRGWVGKKRQYL